MFDIDYMRYFIGAYFIGLTAVLFFCFINAKNNKDIFIGQFGFIRLSALLFVLIVFLFFGFSFMFL